MTSCVAIIPARGGSQRIPEKNIKLFHGKPIIAYSIETALASGLFDQVIVSTDSQKIADIAEMYGATVMMRNALYSQDDVGTQDVARHVLDKITKNGHKFDYACVIYATAPMMTTTDLQVASFTLWQDADMNFVMSIGNAPLADAGQFYFGKSDAFGVHPLIAERNTAMRLIPKHRVCDINTMEDWERAEKMYLAWKGPL